MATVARDDERTRYLLVGGWNVAFGYGLFLALLALIGGPLSALARSPLAPLALVGRYYYLVVSWIGWAIAAPQDALSMRHLAYRSAGSAFPQVRRVYSVYLPAQVLATAILLMSVRLLHVSPPVGALVAIAIAAVCSYLGHRYLAFSEPLQVGEVPPADCIRAYRPSRVLRELWMRDVAVVRDVAVLPRSLAAGRRPGMKPPYVLYEPGYSDGSAGAKACHRLLHELNEHGMTAYSLRAINPEWNETRISRIGYRIVRAQIDPIVIYTETVCGNPLNAEHFVRWILFTPDGPGGNRYPDSELVFTWSKQFYDTDRILMVDTIERELFNSTDLPEKDTDCVYLGKAAARGVQEIPLTLGMTHITRFPLWPPMRKALADLLRRTRVLYTYDDCTMLIDEALLCGCEVILLPEGLRLTEANTAGRRTQQEYDAQLTRFIDETQRAWPGRD
jgi:hypothetical protein